MAKTSAGAVVAALISLQNGDSPRFGILTTGQAITHDATGHELTDDEKRELAAGSPEFELVESRVAIVTEPTESPLPSTETAAAVESRGKAI